MEMLVGISVTEDDLSWYQDPGRLPELVLSVVLLSSSNPGAEAAVALIIATINTISIIVIAVCLSPGVLGFKL